jgi:hypothetical protein
MTPPSADFALFDLPVSRWDEPRICELCECTYVPKYRPRPGAQQRWCSKSCAQAWRNGARPPYDCQSTKMARQVAVARAKRLRHAETWDGITDEEILERDGWRCQIPGCKRRPIRKDVKYPHSRSKSVDHIVPLSFGGDDTAENKRAAHLGCNLARGNKAGLEQVALFGGVREPPLVTRTASGAKAQRPPKPPKPCGVCGEPLVAGRCQLHLPVYFLACDRCGGWFAAPGRKMRYCGDETCRLTRRRQRVRERYRDDPEYWARQRAAMAKWRSKHRGDPEFRERERAATAKYRAKKRAAALAASGQLPMIG